jgi:hypothetical protein
MVKKFVTIVMVLGIFGGILAGCNKADETAAPATTAPAETAGGTAGGAAPAAPATGG